MFWKSLIFLQKDQFFQYSIVKPFQFRMRISFPVQLLRIRFGSCYKVVAPSFVAINQICHLNYQYVYCRYRNYSSVNDTRSISSSSTTSSNINFQAHSIRYPRLPKGHLKTMKIESEYFKELFTPELNLLNDLFKKYGYELRIAGGPVRDLIMDIKPADLDFATVATPDEMKEMFTKEGIRMINTKGEKHGTITARINDKENFEITTLRIDVVTDGRHAEVEFTKNWELDAGRRDLTINSMFMDFDGVVYDYFNGYEDIQKRLVKFVGKSEDRIQEDYLRILRYFRFYGRVALTADEHDTDTMNSVKSNISGLGQISGERIWTELKKILQGTYKCELMLKMLELGIGPYIGLPDNLNIEEFKRITHKCQDLGLVVNPITLITALLNNMEEAMAFHTRIKLSAFERDLSYFLVLHRNEVDIEQTIKPYQHIVLFSKSPAQSVSLWVLELLMYKGEKDLYEKFKNWEMPRFPVNGHMLLERRVPRGKLMSVITLKLKEDWVDSNFKLTSDELLSKLPTVLEELGITLK